jgi:hypothetical protein
MTDRQYYEGLATELLGRWNRLRSFTKHSPSVGFHHEEILRATLRDLISPRFQLRSGFSFGSSTNVSRQGDILVVDENDPSPYLFRQGDLVVAQPRAIACVIEVKTRLTKRDFLHGIRNLATFQVVADQAAPKRHPATYIFAFDSKEFEPDVLSRWYRSVATEDSVRFYPRAILSLRRGILYVRPHPATGQFGHHLIGNPEGDTAAQALSIMLASIRKHVEMFSGVDSNPYEHAFLENMRWSVNSLRFGVGMQDQNGKEI